MLFDVSVILLFAFVIVLLFEIFLSFFPPVLVILGHQLKQISVSFQGNFKFFI